MPRHGTMLTRRCAYSLAVNQVLLLAFIGAGSVQERVHVVFWTLDRWAVFLRA